ncbi:hypothetical protein EV191_10590 [Tamaricihabitans halophyticus]|uniref:Glycosyltransferase involved in cell wall biogenesis n=1 Tax=Tamaricihabitans halophyticus TaxID=1262583 RepID=A0A4R2QVW0_9PSEU|nr:DUF2064 domain-containing protein [Tamaricihabitans halophyticus]TCP53028.1 hypothetical protein EV191_10590 [Tamaricihabitans halophyticus]
MNCCLLIVAKAPVPGKVKTRLVPPLSHEAAAELAAACLLDTIDNVRATPGTIPVLALTGDLRDACRAAELHGALENLTVLPQRGEGLAERLANAHADLTAQFPCLPVLQIGMDTPQASSELLHQAVRALAEPGTDGVLGPASDGGWWALGLRAPLNAGALHDVPMSTQDTGKHTLAALASSGLRIGALPEISDVDTYAQAFEVASKAPSSRFANTLLRTAVYQ